MNLTPHLLAIGLLTALFVYFLHFRKPKRQQIPSTGDVVITEYSYILERIENVVTKSELAWLESLTYEFEEAHRSHAWTGEMFSELMLKIQEQHNMLSVKSIQQKT